MIGVKVVILQSISEVLRPDDKIRVVDKSLKSQPEAIDWLLVAFLRVYGPVLGWVEVALLLAFYGLEPAFIKQMFVHECVLQFFFEKGHFFKVRNKALKSINKLYHILAFHRCRLDGFEEYHGSSEKRVDSFDKKIIENDLLHLIISPQSSLCS